MSNELGKEVTDPTLLNELNSSLPKQPSLANKYGDYLEGLSGSLLQNPLLQLGSQGGYHLANLPSYAYEAFAGKPLYTTPKPEFGAVPMESEAGQFGEKVGKGISGIADFIATRGLAKPLMQAFTKYQPLTENQMGRNFRRVETDIANADQQPQFNLVPRDIFEAQQLLEHPALEARGATGKALTPMGRQAILQGMSQGQYPALFSAQSLLGSLREVLPGLGEGVLTNTRVTPLQQRILGELERGLNQANMPETAQALEQARASARRYYNYRDLRNTLYQHIKLPAYITGLLKALGH